MKRVDIVYGGERYSIGGRDLDDVKEEIGRGVEMDSVYWLEVNSGEGQLRPALLALRPGISIALMSAHDD